MVSKMAMDLAEFKSLPAPRQDTELEAKTLAGIDNYILQALSVNDKETLAFLVPYHRGRCEQGEKLYVILKCRDWWWEKNLELWKVNDSYDSFEEYVRDQGQDAISTVWNYCAVWEFYHETLGWPAQKMAIAGLKKLEVVLAQAKRLVENGELDIDLEDALLDENLSYRDVQKAYRAKKDELFAEDESGLHFKLYSFEHVEKHLRGILEAEESVRGNIVVYQVGKFNKDSKIRHLVHIIADKIGAEVV